MKVKAIFAMILLPAGRNVAVELRGIQDSINLVEGNHEKAFSRLIAQEEGVSTFKGRSLETQEKKEIFGAPSYDGRPLDICLTWTWRSNCGGDGKEAAKPAAADFCRTQGYERLVDFETHAFNNRCTKLIGTGQSLCFRRSFKHIECAGEGEQNNTFLEPKYEDYALDYCLADKKYCDGKYVANAFCRMKGFKQAEAEGFKKAENWDGKSTKFIGTGDMCDSDIETCNTFDYIICTSNPQY